MSEESVSPSRSEKRLQALYGECQSHVVQQLIEPFGLNQAMFEDRNGGNVTTMHNFSRKDADYVATDADRVRHTSAHTTYDKEVRSTFELKTETAAKAAGTTTFQDKRAAKIAAGLDEVTGKRFTINADGTAAFADGKAVNPEADHIVPIKKIHENKKTHLALIDVKEDGKADTSRAAVVVNDEANLALTNKSLNASKGAKNLDEWTQEKNDNGFTNAERFGVDAKRAKALQERAEAHVEQATNKALLDKQKRELLQTGGEQAARMGIKQALGILLVELVNGLFNDLRELIRSGVELGAELLKDIGRRLKKLAISLASKLPSALWQGIQGGLSGFVSNLVTFLLNNFVSTAKRFVTAIRESLLGLVKALKMIFFPPKEMTSDAALQKGMTMLAAVAVGVVALLMQESVTGFLMSLPPLAPFAEMVGSGLIAIVSGLLTAFIGYHIARQFDLAALREEQLDAAIESAAKQQELATALTASTAVSLQALDRNIQSIQLYQTIGRSLAEASSLAASSASIGHKTAGMATLQVANAQACIQHTDQALARFDQLLKPA